MYLLKQYPHLKCDETGSLKIEGIRYDRLVDNYDTPLYIYSLKRIKENCQKIKKVLKKSAYNNFLFYSYKTNFNREICKVIHEEGLGAEITSYAELKMAMDNGVDPHMIIFDGPFKTERALKKAVQSGIRLINIDSINEIKKIDEIASKFKVKQEIGITFNPDDKSKIGVKNDDTLFDKLLSYLKKFRSVEITAFHCHIKTQNQKLESYKELLENFYNLREIFNEKIGVEIKNFDLGGGFPEAAIIKDKINNLSNLLCNVGEKFGWDINLIFEPGRFIVGDAGILLTRIVNVKNINSKNWIIIDAGTNVMSPFSKSNNRFLICNRLLEDYSSEVNIGGPLPASFDVITRNYCLPENINEGNILAILNAGAYCQSFTIDFGEKKFKTIYLE